MSLRPVPSAITAATLLLLFAVGSGSAEATSPGPTLDVAGQTVARTDGADGDGFTVQASGLMPGASYVFTTDTGEFTATGTQSVTVTGDSDGYASSAFAHTDTAPASQAGVRLELEDATGGTVYDDVTVPFGQPAIASAACPSTIAAVSGFSLPDGTYVLSSPYGTFSPANVTVTDGQLASMFHAGRALPVSYPITATNSNDPAVHYTGMSNRLLPSATGYASVLSTPWQYELTVNCLSPGESFRPTNSDRAHVTAVTTTVAANGTARVILDLHPGASDSASRPVHYQGTVSGQSYTAAGVGIPGSTLTGGRSLRESRDPFGRGQILASASSDTSFAGPNGYAFAPGCDPAVAAFNPDGSQRPVRRLFPTSNHTNCTFTLRTDGDLVLSTGGKIFWTSDTTGTTTGNRLVMSSDGIARLYTATNAILWTLPASFRQPVGKPVTPTSSYLTLGASLTRGHYRSLGDERFGVHTRQGLPQPSAQDHLDESGFRRKPAHTDT